MYTTREDTLNIFYVSPYIQICRPYYVWRSAQVQLQNVSESNDLKQITQWVHLFRCSHWRKSVVLFERAHRGDNNSGWNCDRKTSNRTRRRTFKRSPLPPFKSTVCRRIPFPSPGAAVGTFLVCGIPLWPTPLSGLHTSKFFSNYFVVSAFPKPISLRILEGIEFLDDSVTVCPIYY